MSAERDHGTAVLDLGPSDASGCIVHWLAGRHRVLVAGPDARDLATALRASGHEVTVSPSPAHGGAEPAGADTSFDAVVLALGLGSAAADQPAAIGEALRRLAPGGITVVTAANAVAQGTRLAVLDGNWPASAESAAALHPPHGHTRRSLFALVRESGGAVTAFARVLPPAGLPAAAAGQGVLAPLVAPLLALDPTAVADEFIARVERSAPAAEAAALELETALADEEAAAALQIRQIVAIYDNDRAALQQVRLDFIDLARSRMVRWGSMPGRLARFARRMAGRVLRLLRLRR